MNLQNQNSKPEGRYATAHEAIWSGVAQLFKKGKTIRNLSDTDRLDGKTCLVTGANSGLGFGIACLLAERGADVIMACRRNYVKQKQLVARHSDGGTVQLRIVDLSDFDSIDAFLDGLQQDQISIDVSIHNAGVTPAKARKTNQGLDEMFMVNYLSKFYLINELIKRKIIFTSPDISKISRIVLISSDSHQGASPILFEKLGEFEDYKTPNRGIALYSYNKLLLNTFAVELKRKLEIETNSPRVFTICPGPVDSNIIKEAPLILRLFMRLIFKIFFKNPMKAGIPVVFLASAPEILDSPIDYLHMNRVKRMDPKCYDEDYGHRLWLQSHDLIEKCKAKGH